VSGLCALLGVSRAGVYRRTSARRARSVRPGQVAFAAEYQYRVLFLNEDKTDDFSFAGRCRYGLDSILKAS